MKFIIINKELTILIGLITYKSLKKMMLILFRSQKADFILYGNYLKSQESYLQSIISILITFILLIIMKEEMKKDLIRSLEIIRNCSSISLIQFLWTFVFACMLGTPWFSTYIWISKLTLGYNIIFIDKLFFDTFTDLFLYIYILYGKAIEGKSFQRVTARGSKSHLFYLFSILILIAVLMTHTFFYSDFDDQNIFTVFLTISLYILLVYEYFRCFFISYFLFMTTKILTVFVFSDGNL